MLLATSTRWSHVVKAIIDFLLRALWLGMIIEQDSLSLAQILNIYVRHELIFPEIGKEAVDIS